MRFTYVPPPPEPPEEDEPPPYVPPGEYEAQIVGAQLKQTTSSGEAYVSWQLVLRGVHPKFRLWWATMLSGKAAWLFANLHEAITGERPEEEFVAEAEDYFYRPFTVHVVHDHFAGRTVSRVRTVHRRADA